MALRAVEEGKEEILRLLSDNTVSTIILVGKHGVGKTWMARQIRDLAPKKGLTYDLIPWVYLNRKFDRTVLHEKIAQDMSLLSAAKECGHEDEKVKHDVSENFKRKITDKLVEKAIASSVQKRANMKQKESTCSIEGKKKFFLVILDDVPLIQNEQEIVSELRALMPAVERDFFKVLMTRRENDSGLTFEELKQRSENGKTRVLQIVPLQSRESSTLFQERIKVPLSGSRFKLADVVAEMSSGTPGTIITIAEALEYMKKYDSEFISSLECDLQEASSDQEAAYHLVSRLRQCWYDSLSDSILINCCLHSMDFFRKHGGLHYNELIAHWILEGYFGSFGQIQKAYEQAHYALMELVDRGILKLQKDSVLVMEGSVSNIIERHCFVFNQFASPNLAHAFENEKWEGFGRIIKTDGMIKSLCGPKSWERVSTLLIDGRSLCRENTGKFLQQMQELQVLAIFNPRLRLLPFSGMEKLRVLVLRGCDSLENVDHIRDLEDLRVLEISGAFNLMSIPGDFFFRMANLRSINLSSSKFKSLPASLLSRSALRRLILIGCSRLEELGSLEKLENLEIIDLSGAISLKTIRDKSFSSLKRLQVLNLSGSQINSLPSLDNLGDLTHILLSDCSCLTRLPSLETVPRLQILDLSGARGIEIIDEQSFMNKDELKMLHLSGTAIQKLPSNIRELNDLYLKDCLMLLKFPSTREIKHLEVLDLSGASGLVEIEDTSFNHQRFLRILNLSKSKIEKLPSLSEVKRLKVLNLSGCANLVELPHLNSLQKLEVLDLSGCNSLRVTEDKCFDGLSHLQTLDFSDTKIEFLPTLCSPSNLIRLVLRNCTNLKKLSPMEHLLKLEELNLSGASALGEFKARFLDGMTHLQILDLSGTLVMELPSMDKLKRLKQLKLRDCSFLLTVKNLDALTVLELLDMSGTKVRYIPSLHTCENLRQLLLKDLCVEDLQGLRSLSRLEVLDLSGTSLKRFPYGISKLNCLKRLDLPKDMDEIDWGHIRHLPKEVNWDKCGIRKHVSSLGENENISISLSGTGFFEHLEKNPELWGTVFKRFCFFVGPVNEQGEDESISFCKAEPFFRDVYFHARHFPTTVNRFLEIHGSYLLPNGFESVLKRTRYLSLIDNKCLSCFSDLGSENVLEMRGCWIERCAELESILCGEDEGTRVGRNIEILWISNLPRLKSLYGGNLQRKGFENLKHLYLDSCPMIINVFSSSQLPENLETVHVKFCDRLETLFQCKEAGFRLQKLRFLRLFELPEFRSIGVQFPSDQLCVESVKCPKFVNL